MADGVNILVYRGGEQVVPRDVTRFRIHRSVKIIRYRAFHNRRNLVSVETHNEIEQVEDDSFVGCISLRGIKLLGVREIGEGAFLNCISLTDVEFGDKLETIGENAFDSCPLQKIKIPSVRTIEAEAFYDCEQLTDAELPDVERIGLNVFNGCPRLRRIALPLKDNMFPIYPHQQRYTQFDNCDNLTTVDLLGVGGIHKTISSLLLERWRDEMNEEIDRINQDLPNTPADEKTAAIHHWIRSVIDRMEHYKTEHNRLLKEDMTLLELAVWMTKLDEKEEDNSNPKIQAKKAKIVVESRRNERRITSGANIVIKNVLPFLKLE